MSLLSGETTDFTDMAVGPYRVAVQDPLSNDLVPVGSKPIAPSGGRISFSLRLFNATNRYRSHSLLFPFVRRSVLSLIFSIQ